ncbi:MAG TPA: alpha/beta hydrolase [Steroidobacteraceae bacterium]|nr:alpha/beta hydrolase [Steroidobacteraceae bacterium]
MSFRVMAAVLRKDLRCLLPMVLLAAPLFAADVIILRWELVPMWADFRQALLIFVGTALTLAVVQLDSAASLVDDWLARPVPTLEMLTAKLSLLVLVVYLPGATATLVLDLCAGASLPESLQDALLIEDPYFLLVIPIVLITAAVTRTLVQGIGALIAVFICLFLLPAPFVRAPGPMNPHIGDSLLNNGMIWMIMTPAKALPLLLAAVGLWLVYWRRRILAARVMLVAIAAVTLLAFITPMWLIPWSSVFAAQATLEGTRAPASAQQLSLRSTRECFPATRVGQIEADAAFNAAREASSLRMWSSEDLRESGPGSVAFLTQVDTRRMPQNWRFVVNHAQADFYGASVQPLFSLRPASYASGTSHAWVLPDFAVEKLNAEERVSLKLNYSLTLLEPRRSTLQVDGQRRELPGIGYCRASLATTSDSIEVECFSGFRHPAQISATLNDIFVNGDSTPFDFSPAWTQWLTGRRSTLRIRSPRLAAHDTITVTAWQIAGYLEEEVALPGILGADIATCPLPVAGKATFQQTRWRDAAPHEASSISVQDGVQLEVLDFSGQGSPILLLPGLGATAHSYDDLGPQLARQHRVVALTRRGAGYSSRPDFGFDTPRLAQDVLQVMDAMSLDQVLLVGHSIAGDELTWLGGHHPQRFSGLVYLDAAYDRSGYPHAISRQQELYRRLPPEAPLPLTAFANYVAMSKLLAERGHLSMPEGELIAFRQVDKPWLGGNPNIDPRAQQAILAASKAPDYAAVKLPALALYAIEDPTAPAPPWYDRSDVELQATLAEIAQIKKAAQRRNIEAFRRGVVHGEVIELPNAEHYVIQSNPREVLEAIEQFAARR